MTCAPIAAHANTRASDNNTVYSGSAADNPSGDDTFEAGSAFDEADFFVWLLAGAWATGILFIVFEDDNQSPGGN